MWVYEFSLTRILPYKDRIVDPALYGRKGVSENPHSHIFSILYLLKTPVNFWLHAVSKRYKIITLALNGLMNSQLHDPHCVKSVQIRSFFWAVVSRIRTEYGEIRSISQYSVQMKKNADQNNFEYGHLLRSDICYIFLRFWFDYQPLHHYQLLHSISLIDRINIYCISFSKCMVLLTVL